MRLSSWLERLPLPHQRERRFAAPVLHTSIFITLLLAACAARAQELTIAVSRTTLSLPVYVAESQRYFADEGVAVRTRDSASGVRSLQLMFDGGAHLATSSELPVMFSSFTRSDYAIIATFVTSARDIKIVVRKSAGIEAAAQLPGRRVGTVKGTSAHYFLDAYLLFHGQDPRRVDMVALQPEDIAEALRDGRIDAAVMWEPFAYRALKALGQDGRVLPGTRIYTETFNLVAGRALIAAREGDLVKLLRALQRAQDFIRDHPTQAQAILKARLNEDQALIEATWTDLDYRLSLNQSLVSTLEGEARWALREGHVAPGRVAPDYLQFVEPAALRRAVPGAAMLVK